VKDRNYRRKGEPQLIIAFKEIRLLAEFASEFYSLVNAKNKSDYETIRRYVSLVYGDTATAIDALLADYDSSGNEAAKTAAEFLERAKASTALGRRREELEKARVIFTTHASLINLCAVGLTFHRDIICDESPDNLVIRHLLCWGQTKDGFDKAVENHLISIGYDATSIDENKAQSSAIGKRLDSGIFKITKAFEFSPEKIRELNTGADDKPIRDKTPSGVFFSYVDLRALNANSIMFLTAKPEGTQLRVLEQCAGKRMACYETEQSKARRASIKSACKYVTLPGNVSCAKTNATSEETKAIIAGVMAAAKNDKNDVLIIAHAWRGDSFRRAGLSVCKLNQTGSNVHQNKHLICVLSLSFFNPLDVAAYGGLFGNEFVLFQRDVISANLGQSVLRGALRKRTPELSYLIACDERVFGYFNCFLA
jgi:hypothetical protein